MSVVLEDSIFWDTQKWVPYGAERVSFPGYEVTTLCWAHRLGCEYGCPASDLEPGHPCNEPGVGRLGLCESHEKEVL